MCSSDLEEDRVFDLSLFNEYLRRYMSVTRLRIINHPHPDEIPAPSTWDLYPSQSVSGSRQHAVNIRQLSKLSYLIPVTCP